MQSKILAPGMVSRRFGASSKGAQALLNFNMELLDQQAARALVGQFGSTSREVGKDRRVGATGHQSAASIRSD